MLVRALAFIASCSVCCAQISLGGVVSGYVLDGRSATIRPVLGVPGAAYLGTALALPWGVTAAGVRGSRDVAVAISNEQPRRAYVLHNLAGIVSVVPLDGTLPDSDRVFLSGDGSAAAIVSSAQQQLQVVTNLASAPAVSSAVPLALRGNITAVAVSSSGCALAAGADTHSGGQVVEVCASQPGVVIPIFDRDAFHPTAVAWLDSRSAAVADAASNQVLLFANLDGSAPTVLMDQSSGIDSPIGVTALDSSTLAVALTGDRERTMPRSGHERCGCGVLMVARTDGSLPPRTVPLPIAPSQLDALDTPSILVLNALVDSPLLLVDTQQNYSAFFVPMN
jgi:hypothetical protein